MRFIVYDRRDNAILDVEKDKKIIKGTKYSWRLNCLPDFKTHIVDLWLIAFVVDEEYNIIYKLDHANFQDFLDKYLALL